MQWSEPAGRDKSLFSSLMRDAIYGDRLPYGLTKDDCHMILLGLQSGVWEAAREAHSFASDVLDIKLTPGMPIETWRTRLEKWYRHTEQDCSIQKDYFLDAARRSTSDHDYLPPVTLLIRHMASIKMHAPLTILQLAVPSDLDVGACHIPSTTEEQHSRLKIWLESSCPRIAVYSASQIARVAMYELQDLPPAGIAGPLPLLNPLIVPGLLMSAMVVYSYVRCISACGACINLDTDRQEGLASSSHHSRPGYANLNLHEMDDLDDQALIEWKNSGHGLATIGHELIPLCKCKKPEVKTYFRRLLAVDRKAETGFLAFTRETSD